MNPNPLQNVKTYGAVARLISLVILFMTLNACTSSSGPSGLSDGSASSETQSTSDVSTETSSGGTNTASGVATLTWDMPIQRVDGSDLKPVEIATYRIYHGTSLTSLKMVAQTKDGQTTTYQVTGLEAGKTHYFYVTAVDLNYLESPPSETKQKSL
jgi:hypothetical protein